MATRAATEAIRQDIAVLGTDIARKDLNEIRQDMSAGCMRLERELANTRVDMIKWSFLFWTGQCVAILGFLLVFLRNR